MSWITDSIKKAKKALGFKDAGDSKGKCPLVDTGLLVGVENSLGDAVEGAIVDIAGKSPFNKKTNKDGIAGFKPVEPDNYKIKVKLTAPLSNEYEVPDEEEETVFLGECPVHIIRLVPLVTLKVRVINRTRDKLGKTVETALDGVKIHIVGRDTKDETTPKDSTGWASFKQLKTGKYEITVTSLGSHASKFKVPGKATTVFETDEKVREVTLEVRPQGKLQIVLFDKDDKPIADKAWELLSPIRATGKTGADGLIKVEDLNMERTTGVLNVDMGVPVKPKPKAPVTPPPDTAEFPPLVPPIKPDEFKHKAPEPPEPVEKEGMVEWSLKIGLLEDYDDEAGIKSRLHNLGFDCESSSDATVTTAAVKAYQKHYQKQDSGSGSAPDIKVHIQARHNNP